jgi:hypothetical protein
MTNEESKFLAYEKVRRGGKTNMFDVRRVINLAKARLTEDDCFYIMKHYAELAKKYLELKVAPK